MSTVRPSRCSCWTTARSRDDFSAGSRRSMRSIQRQDRRCGDRRPDATRSRQGPPDDRSRRREGRGPGRRARRRRRDDPPRPAGAVVGGAAFGVLNGLRNRFHDIGIDDKFMRRCPRKSTRARAPCSSSTGQLARVHRDDPAGHRGREGPPDREHPARRDGDRPQGARRSGRRGARRRGGCGRLRSRGSRRGVAEEAAPAAAEAALSRRPHPWPWPPRWQPNPRRPTT
jgi:hypothetical protein